MGWLNDWLNPKTRGFRATDVERGIYKLEPSPGLRAKLREADERLHGKRQTQSTAIPGNWMHDSRTSEARPCPFCHAQEGEPCADRDMRGLPVVTTPAPPAPPVKPPRVFDEGKWEKANPLVGVDGEMALALKRFASKPDMDLVMLGGAMSLEHAQDLGMFVMLLMSIRDHGGIPNGDPRWQAIEQWARERMEQRGFPREAQP